MVCVEEAIVVIYDNAKLILYSQIQHAMLIQVNLALIWLAQHTVTSISRSNFRAHIYTVFVTYVDGN